MPRKPNPPLDDKEQATRFVETAKSLGLDKTDVLFEKTVNTLLTQSKEKLKKSKKS